MADLRESWRAQEQGSTGHRTLPCCRGVRAADRSSAPASPHAVTAARSRGPLGPARCLAPSHGPIPVSWLCNQLTQVPTQ